MKRAFIWTREHSPERLRMIDALRRTWECLFEEHECRGHYASIQWCGKPYVDWHRLDQFQCVVDGHEVTAHMCIVTARAWYARVLYRRALALTRARYPDFDAHEFVDGDRVGERRIKFSNERHALSGSHLYTALWITARDSNPVIREACMLQPCSEWGSPVGAEGRFETFAHPDHVLATVIRNVKDAKDGDASGVIADLKAQRVPVLCSDPLTFSFDDIRGQLVEVSHPELVLLNWKDALPVLTVADEALWAAARQLDADGVERAIADGANVNSMCIGEDNLLSSVIKGWGDYRYRNEATAEQRERERIVRPDRQVSHAQMLSLMGRLLDAGTHPDLHVFDGIPAIIGAALAQDPAIASLLLDHGADNTVQAHWDEGPGQWPSAWYYASTDGFNIDCEAGARAIYYEMIKRGSSPLFEQGREDADKREAELPDCLHLWYPPPWSFGPPPKPVVENSTIVLTDKIAATAFARAWNRLDPEPFLGLLAADAHYASQWVFEELESRQAIAEYLRAKMNTVRNLPANDADRQVRAELTTCRNGQDCVAMTQGQSNDVLAVVVFSIVDHAIARYDMCVPQLMAPRHSDVFPI